MRPFIILALPRSRTAWLSRFLSYGDWVCGHEELRHMRSMDDVAAWFSQPYIGTIETAGAPWWRLLDRFAPEARIVLVRRPVDEVVDSLMRLDGCIFDRERLYAAMVKLDRKLDQIAARVSGVMQICFADLEREEACAQVFEFCTGLPHDGDHWRRWESVNVQIDMRAMLRHFEAYRPQMEKLAKIAKHQTMAMMQVNEPESGEGLTIQTEGFESWLSDSGALFDEHLIKVGEAPGDWLKKNIPLMRALDGIGAMMVTTARSNGRVFGYLMTIIGPSLVSEGITSATHTTFYASPSMPGLGLKLQRHALQALKARGVDEVLMQTSERGSGDRMAALYRRIGAEPHGQSFRLSLAEAA